MRIIIKTVMQKVLSTFAKLVVGAGVVAVLFVVKLPAHGYALGLKAAPLLYNVTLQKGDIQKGYIDVSNPDDVTKDVTVTVEGFKQVNNSGDLGFFAAPEYATGIQLDYQSFSLGPRQAVRFVFQLDSSKLPKGGVYGTIFFGFTTSGVSPDTTSVKTITRVGTLLLINNGGGGTRQANIESVTAPFWQVGGNQIKAKVAVKNTSGQNGLAYFPTIETAVQPFGRSSSKQGSLVFPGISRENTVTKTGSYFGLIRLKINVGTAVKYKWVFVATGKARFIAVGLLVTALVLGFGLVALRRFNNRRKKRDGTLD